MIILAIETSCDDTSLAVLRVRSKNSKVKIFEILANIVSSQVKIHRKYGGIYPSLAKREHQKNLPIVLKKALKETKESKIDLIAVTIGPGLEPCLWTGINFAKDLAKKLKLPIVPINHLEAHIMANFIGQNWKLETGNSKIFPAVCLVVSGGHTQLILMKEIGQYKLIGQTRDDSAGECFDKTARILGLTYPGGPAIERLASQRKLKIRNLKFQIRLPRPMIQQKNYDFSFSGLKTAVLYDFQKRSERERSSKKYLQTMARKIQEAIVDVLTEKTLRAAKEFKARAVILGGGVAANEKLRKEFISKIKSQKLNLKFLKPEKIFCTDNAVMVGVAAYFHFPENITSPQKIEAQANLQI